LRRPRQTDASAWGKGRSNPQAKWRCSSGRARDRESGSALEGGRGLENTATLLMYLIPPAIMFVYLVLLEGIFGTTVGKLLGASPWQLAVVRKDGTRCGLGRAALRALLLPFEANPLGAIVVWATAGNQRIGDLLAGTLVVDRRKPHKLTYLDRSAVLELVDGRRFEFAQITRGKIVNWLQFHRMKIEGTAPDGRPVRLTFNFTREKYRMDRLRDELERAFQFRFVETIEWWRLIFIALMLCIIVGGAIGVALSVSPPAR
jgi:uncharacterized RDD family membrane protein YckC